MKARQLEIKFIWSSHFKLKSAHLIKIEKKKIELQKNKYLKKCKQKDFPIHIFKY